MLVLKPSTPEIPRHILTYAEQLKMLDDKTLFFKKGCRPVLIKVRYRLPDAPSLEAPPFWWNFLDDPDFLPRVLSFLNHWKQNLPNLLISMSVDVGRETTGVEVSKYFGNLQ